MKIYQSEYHLKKPEDLLKFRSSILSWYRLHKRDLPWRKNPSVYKTVVSEFMLQQTRVVTVIPYFENWIRSYPDFLSLAKASEDQVLKSWEGLGYYSRARNLHNLAKIVSSWEKVPESMEAWKALPGVGPYIAAAVTSIAFQKVEAVCDGNLVRVLTRIFSIKEKFKDGATAQKKLQTTAQSLMDQEHPGDFNQAMMELGAIQCFRQSPLCVTCPVLIYCSSGQAGTAEQFPKLEKKKKKKKSIRRYWIESEKGLLLFSNPHPHKRLSGIYELPECMPSGIKNIKAAEKILLTKKRTIGNVDYLEKIIETSFYAESEKELECGYRWASRKEINNLTLSGPHRKWILEILDLKAQSESRLP